MPPMPTTDRTAPTTSTSRGPVYGDVANEPDARQHDRDDTTSSANPTRQDRNVVMKPPSSGPTAAAMAADAPTSAYTFLCAAPSKLPWISDCIAGSSSDAPSPPMTAQKMTTAVRLWASVIARAPTA